MPSITICVALWCLLWRGKIAYTLWNKLPPSGQTMHSWCLHTHIDFVSVRWWAIMRLSFTLIASTPILIHPQTCWKIPRLSCCQKTDPQNRLQIGRPIQIEENETQRKLTHPQIYAQEVQSNIVSWKTQLSGGVYLCVCSFFVWPTSREDASNHFLHARHNVPKTKQKHSIWNTLNGCCL